MVITGIIRYVAEKWYICGHAGIQRQSNLYMMSALESACKRMMPLRYVCYSCAYKNSVQEINSVFCCYKFCDNMAIHLLRSSPIRGNLVGEDEDAGPLKRAVRGRYTCIYSYNSS